MKNKSFFLITFLVVGVAAVLLIDPRYHSKEDKAGSQVGSSAVLHQITNVASPSIQTIGTVPVRLVDNPGPNCALEVVSVTGFRIFASEAWQFGANKSTEEGFEIRLDESVAGADVIASFSKGLADGGPTSSVASPTFQTRMGADVNASISESVWLTAGTTFNTLDGDTSFTFDVGYRKICTQ